MTQRGVLIIDDNDLNVQRASFVLSQAAFVVESAADATQGLRQIPLFRPDLILMDIQMPDMDGLTLTCRLKADPMGGLRSNWRTAGSTQPLDAAGRQPVTIRPTPVPWLANWGWRGAACRARRSTALLPVVRVL